MGAPVVTVSVRSQSGAEQSVELRRVASLFGTKPNCKFVLRHPTVCRRHCVIVNTGQQVFLRTLDARATTLCKGRTIDHGLLNDGDCIDVGPWKFELDIQWREYTGTSDSPVIVDLEPDPTVLVVEDLVTGKVTKLPRDVSVLGRNADADITVAGSEVSGAHAIIFTYLHKPVIFDLVSENGVSVNGKQCTFAMLSNGDEFSLGGHALKFRCNAPGVRPSVNGDPAGVLKPTPFVNPDDTLSDLIDLSAESISPPAGVVAKRAADRDVR